MEPQTFYIWTHIFFFHEIQTYFHSASQLPNITVSTLPESYQLCKGYHYKRKFTLPAKSSVPILLQTYYCYLQDVSVFFLIFSFCKTTLALYTMPLNLQIATVQTTVRKAAQNIHGNGLSRITKNYDSLRKCQTRPCTVYFHGLRSRVLETATRYNTHQIWNKWN